MDFEDVETSFLKNREVISSEKVFWKRPIYRQIYVALSIHTCIFSAGVGFGTPTVMVPQLQANSTMQVTDEVAGWIYSMHGFASCVTAMIVPKLMQMKGRKPVMFAVSMFALISWILLYFGNSIILIIISEVCHGCLAGGNVTLAIIALAEYTEPKYRGTFLMIKTASYICGIWVANTIGTFYSYKYIALFGLLITIIFSSVILTWPESPEWLASKGRFVECRKSFIWLRGRDAASELELKTLLECYSVKQRCIRKNTSLKQMFSSRLFYMPLSLLLALFTLWVSCGKIIVTMYVLVIIKAMSPDTNMAYVGMFIIDVFSVAATYIGSYLVHRYNKRPLLFTTCLFGIAFLFILAGYTALISFGVIAENPYVSLVSLIAYSFAMSMGPLTMCVAVFAELIPYQYKAVLTSIGVTYFFLYQAINLKIAPYLFKQFGLSLVFALYGVMSSLLLLYLYKYLPETSGKTLKEIEQWFIRKNNVYDKERTEIDEE